MLQLNKSIYFTWN